MKLKQINQTVLRFLGTYFSFGALTLLCKSLRVVKVNYSVIEELKQEKKNFVLAFWHGTMLLPWYLHAAPDMAALTSKSKDGDLLAKLLKKWKYKVVRGSSSSGGNVALGMMVDFAKNNFSIAITPDGPRGPRHIFKAGAVIAAKRCGVPVVLAGVGYKNKKVLNNWDRFEIPYFFSRAKIVYSEPVYVQPDSNYEQTSGIISFCEKILNDLQDDAQKF